MIVCVGATPVYQRTMVFPRLTLDAVNRTASVHDYASGKAVNVARVLNTLGEKALAMGFAGGDRGRSFLHDLAQANIPNDFVQVSTQTRQCITLVDQSAKTATELVEESLPVPLEAWQQLERKVMKLLARHDSIIWIFSGSLTPQAPADTYAQWIPRLARSTSRFIVDLQGEPLRQVIGHPGLVVKVNREELGTSFNLPVASDDDLRKAMQRAVSPGGAVVVTLGREGALAADEKGIWRVPSPQITAVSAVGSGDSFAAGLAAGFRRGLPLPQACALASACGAANALTPYAGHLSPDEVQRLAAQIQVRPA